MAALWTQWSVINKQLLINESFSPWPPSGSGPASGQALAFRNWVATGRFSLQTGEGTNVAAAHRLRSHSCPRSVSKQVHSTARPLQCRSSPAGRPQTGTCLPCRALQENRDRVEDTQWLWELNAKQWKRLAWEEVTGPATDHEGGKPVLHLIYKLIPGTSRLFQNRNQDGRSAEPDKAGREAGSPALCAWGPGPGVTSLGGYSLALRDALLVPRLQGTFI